MKDIFAAARNLTFVERDIALDADADGISDFYSTVRGESNTNTVPLDQTNVAGSVAEVGISSSRFYYFDTKELNVLVGGLRRCTSVMVVSQLGKSRILSPPG
jgi:hypothetical protein